MSYRGVTFNKQMCKSEDDAVIFHTFLNGCAGKVRGCEVTYDDENIYMAPGYFMTYGRLVNVFGTETLTPAPIPTGTQYNRLVFTIDLSQENTAVSFLQGTFEFLSNYNSMPGLIQEDLFRNGQVYQIPIASFTLTVNGISNFKEEMGSVNVAEVWKTINTDLAQYRQQFEVFFDEQKQIILQMMQDLEDQDFVTNTEFEAYSEKVRGDLNTKQNVNTAITTSNISQQSVKYASSAGGVAWSDITGKPSSFPPANTGTYYANSKNVSISTPAWAQGAKVTVDPGTYIVFASAYAIGGSIRVGISGASGQWTQSSGGHELTQFIYHTRVTTSTDFTTVVYPNYTGSDIIYSRIEAIRLA